MENGKIYKYEINSLPGVNLFIHMESKLDGKDTLLYSRMFNEPEDIDKPYEIIIEKIDSNKSILVEDYYVSYGLLGDVRKQSSSVILNQVYNFTKMDSDIVWSVNQYRFENENLIREGVVKIRSFYEAQIKQEYSNKEYDCISFFDKWLVKNYSSGKIERYHEKSYYAKGIGLIRTIRTDFDRTIYDFHLKEIIDYKDFIKN